MARVCPAQADCLCLRPAVVRVGVSRCMFHPACFTQFGGLVSKGPPWACPSFLRVLWTGCCSTCRPAPNGVGFRRWFETGVFFFGVSRLQERNQATQCHPSKGPTRERCNLTDTTPRGAVQHHLAAWPCGRRLRRYLLRAGCRAQPMHL
jgi:hypothetical protein